jgi:predicted transcriptional regulator
MQTKHKTSIALSDDAKLLLKALAKKQGISQSAVIETLIRAKAKAEKIA